MGIMAVIETGVEETHEWNGGIETYSKGAGQKLGWVGRRGPMHDGRPHTDQDPERAAMAEPS